MWTTYLTKLIVLNTILKLGVLIEWKWLRIERHFMVNEKLIIKFSFCYQCFLLVSSINDLKSSTSNYVYTFLIDDITGFYVIMIFIYIWPFSKHMNIWPGISINSFIKIILKLSSKSLKKAINFYDSFANAITRSVHTKI